MSPSVVTNSDLHREAEGIARRILSRKVTDNDAALVFELSNRLMRAESDTLALQATASAARHDCKLAEQQRDEFRHLLTEARIQLPLAAAHWNQSEDDQLRSFHVPRVLELVSRITAAVSPVGRPS